MLNLRKHQREFLLLMSVERGAGQRIVCSVTPGGGKSALPLIAAKSLAEPGRYKIAWVTPRDSLRRQAEESFADPLLKQLTKHNSAIRICQNADREDLSRGLRGFATTYQAILADPQIYYREFEKYLYILFLDEPHHIPNEPLNPWFYAIAPLVNLSRLSILASGTLDRHDAKPVAFLPYTPADDGFGIDYHAENYHFIEYSRYDALAEGAIVPLKFRLFDGYVEYQNAGMPAHRSDTISQGEPSVVMQHLNLMLQTDFAREILGKAVEDWRKHRREVYRDAKLLIVGPDIKTSQEYASFLRKNYRDEKILIATSDNSPAAMAAIKQFKTSRQHNILITVAMAYEGLDVKQITHVVCLTLIRSKPWIEQCLARANRTAPGKLFGVIYAPDDVLFNAVKMAIEESQEKAVRIPDDEGNKKPRKKPEIAEADIIPAKSGINGDRQISTPSEKESLSRKMIEDHVRRAARHFRVSPREINLKLCRLFQKRRSAMNLYELQKVIDYLSSNYPV
jgi:superfamily II DNA or RNA helicase